MALFVAAVTLQEHLTVLFAEDSVRRSSGGDDDVGGGGGVIELLEEDGLARKCLGQLHGALVSAIFTLADRLSAPRSAARTA